MKHKLNLFILLIVSIIFISLGYLFDKDEPYPNIWHSILEFIMLTAILFSFMVLLYFIVYQIRKFIAKKSI